MFALRLGDTRYPPWFPHNGDASRILNMVAEADCEDQLTMKSNGNSSTTYEDALQELV